MQFSVATLIFGLAALGAASPVASPEELFARQANGQCCIPNRSLKQDNCRAANGQAGKCVPGGNACGSALSCVETSRLLCDNNVKERSGVLCRTKVAGGVLDGARTIPNLSQAKVN